MPTTNSAPKEFLTAKEVADRFRVSVQSVYRWAKSGEVKSVRIGGIVRFASADVERRFAGGDAK